MTVPRKPAARSLWFAGKGDSRWEPAERALSADPVLGPIIARVGPCTMRPRRDHFAKLVLSILSQQVSVAAASAMYRTLAARVGPMTPENLAAFLATGTEEAVRGCGLSRQKRGYMVDLAAKWLDGTVTPRRFGRMTDEQLVTQLTQVKGVGKWTAEMLLMFNLARPDVWPADDLALRESIFRNYPARFAERPKHAKDVLDFGDPWRPFRSVAAWYLWRGKIPPPTVTP